MITVEFIDGQDKGFNLVKFLYKTIISYVERGKVNAGGGTKETLYLIPNTNKYETKRQVFFIEVAG